MRDIIFRGKQITNKAWVEGGVITVTTGKSYIVKRVRYYPDTRVWDEAEYYENNPHYTMKYIEVIPESVGQYTGLLDKNGKKIFEGDIVKFARSGDIRTVIFDEHYAEFEFNPKDPVVNPDGVCLCADHDACEIIGNIYDNPELIDGTPHLLEITTSRDQAKGVRVFMKGFVPAEVLTNEELEILERSNQYLKEQENTCS